MTYITCLQFGDVFPRPAVKTVGCNSKMHALLYVKNGHGSKVKELSLWRKCVLGKSGREKEFQP